MTQECHHYWVEDFDYGKMDTRYVACILCGEGPLQRPNKSPLNDRDVGAFKFWKKRLSEQTKKEGA